MLLQQQNLTASLQQLQQTQQKGVSPVERVQKPLAMEWHLYRAVEYINRLERENEWTRINSVVAAHTRTNSERQSDTKAEYYQ